MRLQQWIAKNRGRFEKIKGVNIDENTVEVSKGYAGSYQILEMGQHYLEYRKPENLFPALGKSFKDFPKSKVFQKLENKTKAPIITGNIGEVIAGIVASRTLKFPTNGIGHLIPIDGRTPDYLLKNTKAFKQFLEEKGLADHAEIKLFPEWWVMESKASASPGTVSLTDAKKQLLHIWYRMQGRHKKGIGYGIAVGTSIFEKTIRIQIYIPKCQKCLIRHFSDLRNDFESNYISKEQLKGEIESTDVTCRYCWYC